MILCAEDDDEPPEAIALAFGIDVSEEMTFALVSDQQTERKE